VLRFVNRRENAGFTLVEMLVALAILSILASIAAPYAELSLRREREVELKRALREVRTAIDRFRDEHKAGVFPATAEGVSEDGYPKSLSVLVEGVRLANAAGDKRRVFLRRIPRDPFYPDASVPTAEQWALRGYQDAAEAPTWGGKDVYDVRSKSEKVALDGSAYRSW
jgi:general secretion pathway protein G